MIDWYPMASLANSLKVSHPLDAPTRVRLTISKSLDQIPMPGLWSRGPVFRRLDSGFLEHPLIPKAPPTARLHIDRINGSLRVFDSMHDGNFSEMPPTISLPELRPPIAAPVEKKPRMLFQAAAVGAGFVAGIAAAFLFGWL